MGTTKRTFFRVLKTAFAAASAALLLASCSNITARVGDDSTSAVTTAKSSTAASVTFDISGTTAALRTALPSSVSLSAYTYTLTGTLSGGSEETLCESAAYNKITAAIETGSWSFTITGYNSDGTAVLTGTKSVTVTDTSTISLKLGAATGSTGSVSVTLTYPVELGVATVNAALYDSYSAAKTDAGSALTVTENSAKTYSTVTFTSNSVASGVTKYLAFYLYDSSSVEVTHWIEAVYVVAGLESTSSHTIVGSETTAAITVQKNGSAWTDSGLTLSLSADGGMTSYSMTADSEEALYTASVPAGYDYTVYVNGEATARTVTDSDYELTLNYAVPTLYPAQDATDAFADTQLIMTFEEAPTLVADSEVTITSDSTTVDTISVNPTTADESQTAQSGYTVNVGNQQLVRLDDTSVYIQPHYNGTTSATVLQAETTYTVDVSDILTVGSSYDGIMFADGTSTWSFTTGAAPTLSTTLSVSNATSENSADYFSVYGALFAAVTNGSSSTTYTLDIADGTYYELVSITAKSSQTFILHGSDSNTKGDSVVIEYVNNNHMNNGVDLRALFFQGNGNLVLENITLKNLTQRATVYTYDGYYGGNSASTSGKNNYQAEVLYFNSSSGTISAYNSSFVSLQDTLLTKGKLWFYDCYIAGDVDFMWGYSDVALFENCEIECLSDSKVSTDNAYLFETRVGSTSGTTVGKGYVLLNSTVTVDSGVTAYFGRRATAKSTTSYYDQAAIVNTTFTGSGSLSASRWYDTSVSSNAKDPEVITDATLYKYGANVDVGWKEYNVTNKTATSATESASTYGTMTETEYAAEYSGRRAILNRFFTKGDGSTENSGSYAKDSSTYWAIDTLISNRGYTVAADASVVESSAAVAAAGSTITDTASARTNTVAITSSDTPTGYASVDWETQTYANGVKEVSTRADLITYATAGGYFIIVNGMIDMTNVDSAGTMLPSVGGGTTDALDAFVASNSDYADYASFVAAYVTACSTTTDDSSSSSPESTYGSTLWSLNTAYKNRVQIAVASNTAIVGADASSGIKGGIFSLSGVNHVVIRNMIIRDAYDPFPHHESGDGYNGERDGITIQGSSAHIWIDHCTFEDTLYPSYVYTGGTTKEKWQNYDGLLDIKGDGAYITASYNVFKNHDKTSLIGSGDSEGSNTTRLITYHHNYFYNCGQRMPMVRNTTLHTYNNYFAYDSGAYSQQYAIGPRENAIIYAENNYFDSGITYAFKGSSSSAIYSVGNVRSDGSAASEDNVNYSGVSATDTTTLFSSQDSAPYTYTLDGVSGLSDSSSGISALAGSGDATINGNTYGSSTGSGTTYVTITFNANDGSDSPSTTTQNIVSGTATALTANSFTLDGYTFSGWATSADSTTIAYEDGANITVDADTTLYAVWTETVYYASGTYTLYDADVSKGTALDDGTSDDGAVTWSGLYSNGNNYAYTNASSKITISVSGSSIIKLTGCYSGTNGRTLTVTDSDDNIIVSGVYTSSDQTLTFLYTGDATVLTITWSGYAYISTIVVSDGSSASHSVSAVSVSGSSAISVEETASLTASVTAAYINTDTSVTWTSSDTSVATVDEDGVVTGVKAGTATITATSTVSISVSGTLEITVSSTAVTYQTYSWDFYAASSGSSFASTQSSSTTISAYSDSALSTAATMGVNTGYGIYLSSDFYLKIPVSGASTVIVYVTYQGTASQKLTMYNGTTSLGALTTVSSTGDLNSQIDGIPYAWNCTDTTATSLTLYADVDSQFYIGRIYVDNVALPSASTYTYTFDSDAVVSSEPYCLAADDSAISNMAFWTDDKTNNGNGTYVKYDSGIYANSINGYLYITLPVSGAGTIAATMASANGTVYLYDTSLSSLATATASTSGISFSYTGDAGLVHIAMPKSNGITAIAFTATSE